MKFVCKECGNEDDSKSWSHGEKLLEAKLCIDCAFWHGYIEKKDQPEIARIDGEHYVIGREDARHNRGYGGFGFEITFFDGRVVYTTNLWHQGEIPERFRSRLPNNAKFTRSYQ